MPINLNSAEISSLRLGAVTPSKVMLGTTQVWSNLWTPDALGSQLIAYFNPSNASSLTIASGAKISEMRCSFGRTPLVSQGTSSAQPDVISGVIRVDTAARFWNMLLSSTQDVRQFFIVGNWGAFLGPFTDRSTAIIDAGGTIYHPMDGRNPERFFDWFGVSNLVSGLGQIMLDGDLSWLDWDANRGTTAFSATPRLLGARSSVTSPVDGLGSTTNTMSLQGVALLSSQLSASDNEKLTGYMAHQHGTTAALPAGHPFKSAPPML